MRRMLGGLVAGLSGTLLMEYASNFVWKRQGEQSRERENELRPEMPTSALARKLAGLTGAELSDDEAQRLGMVAHYGFGAAGGPAAVALTRLGVEPLKAGFAVAGAMELFVDQLANTVLGLTAPSWEFPATANVRGALAHVVYGAAVGLMLEAGTD